MDVSIVYRNLESNYNEMVEIRRDLHMNPELSFQEVRTPQKIAEFHENLGNEVRTQVGGRGVVATLKGGKPGKTVALRADFDALPIQDEKEVDYKSQVSGVMHACGHDAHTATLLGLAKALVDVKDDLEGNIVFIHQFAEERAPGGAKPMIEDGCLEGVDVIFGTHLWSNFPLGEVGYREGHLMAAMDKFDIEIVGKGGHGAMPHESIDSLVIGGSLLVNLQSIVSRNIDPLQSAVVTVGTFHGGQVYNVIPDKVSLSGTVRTFDEGVRMHIEERINQVATSTVEAHGAKVNVSYKRGYPAVWNHPDETALIADCAKNIAGESNVFRMKPVMGGEDFAYYLQNVPGAFFFTGARNEEVNAKYPHHHPHFDIDERSMLIAAKTLGTAAINFLQNNR